MISVDPQLCHTRLTLAFEEQINKNFPLIWSDLPWGCRGMAHMDITRNDDRFPARSACSQWHWYDGASWVLGWKPKENQWAYDSRVTCPRGPKVMANYKPWRYKSQKEKLNTIECQNPTLNHHQGGQFYLIRSINSDHFVLCPSYNSYNAIAIIVTHPTLQILFISHPESQGPRPNKIYKYIKDILRSSQCILSNNHSSTPPPPKKNIKMM